VRGTPASCKAALTVISRRKVSQDKPEAIVDLSATDLRYSYLMDAKLDGAFLFGANLCGAWLNRASLVGAELSGAILRNAELQEADLSKGKMEAADLTGARYDKDTRWPPGFDPKSRYAEEATKPTLRRARPR
jgi:Pentapeptide repeats (8 copies)